MWPNQAMQRPRIMTSSHHVYEVRPRKGHRGVALPKRFRFLNAE